MSTINDNYLDTNFDSIQDYFSEDISLEYLIDLSESEREAFFETLYAANELNPTDLAAFEEAFEDELVSLHDELYVTKRELDAMIDSDNLTAAEEANCELMIEDLEEWMDMCDKNGQIHSDWGDAITTYTEKNITVDAGGSTTVNPSDPQDGDIYQVTVDGGSASDGSIFNSEENIGWIDTTDDGYRDTNPDIDGDGIADEDFNHDEMISPSDLTFGQNTATAEITISLEDGDTYSIIPGASAEHAMLKITKEDGTFYYIELTMNSSTKIIIAQLPTNDMDTIPADLLAMMYEKTNSVSSFYEIHTGIDLESEDDTWAIVNMDDKVDDAFTLNAPTPEQFDVGYEYTINFESGDADALTIDAGGNDVSFETDAAGNLVIVLTNTENEEIRITCNGLEYSYDANICDTINITNGDISIDDDTWMALHSFGVSNYEGGRLGTGYGNLFWMLQIDGESAKDIFEDEGYTIRNFGFLLEEGGAYAAVRPNSEGGIIGHLEDLLNP
jgi:hypothetical protein